MQCPSIFGGCVVYLIPLFITAVATVLSVGVSVHYYRKLSREHAEMSKVP